MTRKYLPLNRVPLLSFLLCLVPLLIGIGLGIIEYKTATEIESEGRTALAEIKNMWIKVRWRSRDRYYIQYEFKLQKIDGTAIIENYTEEVSRPHYYELQNEKSVEVLYLPYEPVIVRSEKYSITKFKSILLWLSVAGMLFLPGWTGLLVLITQSTWVDQRYKQYVILPLLLFYLGLLIDMNSDYSLHYFRVIFFMSSIMSIGATLLLIIGDVFHIPWLSDFKARK